MVLTLPDNSATRTAIVDACLWLNSSGLVKGTAGNISVRLPDGILVTPSGIPYDQLHVDMLQVIPTSGAPDLSGQMRPTSEWQFHQSVLATRPDMVAVVHAHPVHATAVAIQRRPIPACHYMVAAFGGSDVPLVDYARFGSQELSDMVAVAMTNRSGCILANHGALTAGETLERALWRMEELELLAQMYLASQMGGAPVLLSDAEIAQVIEAFANYGPARES